MSKPLWHSVEFGVHRKYRTEKWTKSLQGRSEFASGVLSFNSAVKPVSRYPVLRALHGQDILTVSKKVELPYWCDRLVGHAQLELSPDGLITKANGHKIKLTKWLTNMGVSESQVQEVATALNTSSITLKMSTSYRDIVRCAITKHFSSCWCADNVLRLLRKPDVGILLHKDKSGDIILRWICAWDNDLMGLILWPYIYPWKHAYNFTVKSHVDFPVYRTDLRKTIDTIDLSYEKQNALDENTPYAEFSDKSRNCLTPI